MISESIFNGKTTIIPMEEVSHIDVLHVDKEDRFFSKKIVIVTSKTKYNYDKDCYENAIYLCDYKDGEQEASDFLKAWCHYRYEKDIKNACKGEK